MAEGNVKHGKQKDVNADEENENSAENAVRKCLHSVKVSKYDATKLQRDLEGELFDMWSEGCEVMNAKGIPFSKIDGYLDHMQASYEGIDDALRLKMNGILYTEKSWEYKMVEWKFKKADESGARYGMIAFGRSKDQQYVDCMYVLYKMDFKVAPQQIVTKKEHSWLWGLLNYSTEKIEYVERTLGSKSIQAMQNFFRVKALEGFYKEGLIESVNYVNSLEDIPHSK